MQINRSFRDNGVILLRVPASKLDEMIAFSPADQACVPLRNGSGLRFLVCRKVDPSSPLAFSNETAGHEKEAAEKEDLKQKCGCVPERRSWNEEPTRKKIETKFTDDWMIFVW